MRDFAKQTIVAAIALGFVGAAGAWTGNPQKAPLGNAPAPVNVTATRQSKEGILGVGGLGVFGRGFVTQTAGYNPPASLTFGVNGAVGATRYCDQNGQNCVSTIGGSSAISSSASAGNLVYVNPDNTDFAPLECTAGVNYLIDPISFSAASAANFTNKKVAVLKPGNWQLLGTGFLRNRNRDSDYPQALRVSVVSGGVTTHLLNHSIDEGFYTSSVKSPVSVTSGNAEIQVSIKNNRLNAGGIVLWCQN